MNEFLKVSGECARGYLSMNGPITRLEERLTQAGSVHGFECEVYATPTAVFVTAKKGMEVVTTLERSTEISINFTDMLFYDSILGKLSTGDMSLSEAHEKLKQFRPRKYPIQWVTFSAFLIGFVTSYPRYGSLVGAFISGFLAALIYIL